MQKELENLRTVFVWLSNYLPNAVDNIIKNELEKKKIDMANGLKANSTENNETKIQ